MATDPVERILRQFAQSAQELGVTCIWPAIGTPEGVVLMADTRHPYAAGALAFFATGSEREVTLAGSDRFFIGVSDRTLRRREVHWAHDLERLLIARDNAFALEIGPHRVR
jgi:hypothetical protein